MGLETVETLSKKINTPKYTIRKWVREKVIPAYHVGNGRLLYLDIEEVEKIIKKNKAN